MTDEVTAGEARGEKSSRGQGAGKRLRSLRGKGLIALAIALVYMVGGVSLIEAERRALREQVGALEAAYEDHEALVRARAALTHTAMEVMAITYGADGPLGLSQQIAILVDESRWALVPLARRHSSAPRWMALLDSRLDAVRQDGTRASWLELRQALREILHQVDAERERAEERIHGLRDGFLALWEKLTLIIVGFATFGFLAGGGALVLFFARLTADLKRLEERAGEIVRGYRGAPLALERNDEVGSLAAAINRMSRDLHERELRLEATMQLHAHRDKMAAIGALAAGIAHEVNNPLAVIAGIAQGLASLEEPPSRQALADEASRILREVQRAASAARHLADMAIPPASEHEWIDLNGVARNAASLYRYDARFRGVAWELALDPSLPAVHSVGVLVQQVVMDLLALQGEVAAGSPGSKVTIRTAAEGADAVLAVELCGAPADLASLRAALAAPAIGNGREDGPGRLYLSNMILETLGGRIEVRGAAEGSILIACLPAHPGASMS